MTARVLVVDDDPAVRYTIRGVLEDAGITVTEAGDGNAALAAIEASAPDLVLTDLRMPGMDGMALLRRIQGRPAPPRVVMITAHGSERAAVEAIKEGAFDYLRKPFDIDELLATVRRALESVRLLADNERLQGELHLARSMVFASGAMGRLGVLVQRLGPRDITVLLTGESGTGKERVAEALVRASPRRDRPYVRFNCAAIDAELAGSELFGHEKGAFTGSHRARPGLFREADGGSLLLDEVGELDLATQGRLLRVLQEGEIRPVGADRPVKVDVRLIAATHRDLRQRVAEGRFREDLYYRLAVVSLHVPALRERPEDIAPLAEHFLDRFTRQFGTGPLRLPEGFMARLQAWSWPGNVRELQNCIEMLVALSHEGRIDPGLLPDVRPAEEPRGATLKERVDAYERGLIVQALQAAGDNKSEAARILGVSRVTLYDKLRKHGIAGEAEGEGG